MYYSLAMTPKRNRPTPWNPKMFNCTHNKQKMRIEDYLSSLKSRRDFIVQHRKSQKSIIRTLLQDLKEFARRIEDISTTLGFFPEDLERSIVEEYRTSANKSLRMNIYVRRKIRDMDKEIEQLERMMALF